MMDVKLSTENIRAIALFEKITNVSPKDCLITENSLYFLVDPESMGMAIGKSGINMKHIRRIAGKNVKIFPFAATAEDFLRGVIPRIKSLEADSQGIIVTVPKEDKVTTIGKNGENINAIRELLRRHFNVQAFRLR